MLKKTLKHPRGKFQICPGLERCKFQTFPKSPPSEYAVRPGKMQIPNFPHKSPPSENAVRPRKTQIPNFPYKSLPSENAVYLHNGSNS